MLIAAKILCEYFFHNIILKTRVCRTCTLLDPGEMEYFMGWLIIVEKKYKLHVISEFRWPIRPMVNYLKTSVHGLEIVLDEIYCYVTFFWEGYQTGPDLAVYCLDQPSGSKVLAAVLARGTVLPANQLSQLNKPLDSCIVQCHIWISICENDLIKDVPSKCCTL